MTLLDYILLSLCFGFAVASFFFWRNFRKSEEKHGAYEVEMMRKFAELEAKAREIKSLAKASLPDFNASPTTQNLSFSTDQDGLILSVHAYVLDLLGYTSEELLGKPAMGLLFPPVDQNGNDQRHLFAQIVQTPSFYLDYEGPVRSKDGKVRVVSWTTHTRRDPNGEIAEIHFVGFDISDRKAIEVELKKRTVLDPLTSALNKTVFLKTANREFKRAMRYNHPCSFLVIGFKPQPMSAPPNAVDELLKQAISITGSLIRESDTLGRISETDFALLMPETPLGNASILSERLKEKLANELVPMKFIKAGQEEKVLSLQANICFAAPLPDDASVEPILARALSMLADLRKS